MHPADPDIIQELTHRLVSLEKEAKSIRETLLLAIGAVKAPKPVLEVRCGTRTAKVKKR